MDASARSGAAPDAGSVSAGTLWRLLLHEAFESVGTRRTASRIHSGEEEDRRLPRRGHDRSPRVARPDGCARNSYVEYAGRSHRATRSHRVRHRSRQRRPLETGDRECAPGPATARNRGSRELSENDRWRRPSRRGSDPPPDRLEQMPRVLARARRGDRTARPDEIHNRLRQGWARAKDPGGLSEEQPHEYLGCRIFHPRARRRAGLNANSVGRVDGCAQAVVVERADRRAEAIVAASGSVEELLDNQTAVVGPRGEGAE